MRSSSYFLEGGRRREREREGGTPHHPSYHIDTQGEGAAQAELRLTSLTPVKPPGAAAPANPPASGGSAAQDGAAAAAAAAAAAPRASPPFAEASVGEMFAGASGDADWEPDWDTHTSPKQPDEEKWGKF